MRLINVRRRAGPAMLALALGAGCASAALTQEASHRLVLTGVGRFAVFADRSTIQRDGDGVRMRALQVAESGFAVGGVGYWGGWSWWRFDCAGGAADRLDFASLREDGVEGPSMPDNAPPSPAAPGGDAAELMAMACGPDGGAPGLSDVREAVALARAELDAGR